MRYVILISLSVLAGCGMRPQPEALTSVVPDLNAGQDQTRPQSRPQSGPQSGLAQAALRPPSAAARTVEQFDTTTQAERQAAVVAASAPVEGASLGLTLASLGDPAKPGIWLETPLVAKAGPGRVVYPGSGKSVLVDLIPINGPKTAGSRMSLAAMRLIDAPLTGLPEVEVFSE